MKTNQEKSNRLATAFTNVADLIGPIKTDMDGNHMGLNMMKEENECREKALQIRNGLFITQVMGSYNCGKSTSINALIRKKVLPALIRPTTAILTIVQYGEQEECTVYFKETQTETGELIPGEIATMSIEEFSNTYTYTDADDKEYQELGYVKRFSAVDHAVVKVNSKLLSNSNQLLDCPGLRNNIVDNSLALEMANKANAIIYIGTAGKAGFDMDDKEYFYQNFGTCPTNVFFLVNKFDTCRTEEDRKLVRSKVELDLAPFFTDEDGNINSTLMQKRIFYVSALNAINSIESQRINEYGEIEQLSEERCQKLFDNSGFGPFVTELESFLNNDTKNTIVFTHGIKHLEDIQKKAQKRVDEDKLIYENGCMSSSNAQSKAQKLIENIELKISATETAINSWSLKLQSQCSEVVRNSVQSIDDTWEQDVLDIAGKTRFSFGKFLKLSVKQLNFFRSKEQRSKEVEKMLEPFASAVTEHIGKVISKNIEANMPAIEKTIHDAETEIGTSFKGVKGLLAGLTGNLVQDKAKLEAPEVNFAQQLISLYFGDLSEMASGAGNGKKSWLEFIKRTFINTLWQWAVVISLTGPLAPFIILAIEAWQMKKAKDNHAINALNRAKTSIMTGIRTNIDRIIEEKNLMLAKQMDKIKESLCKNYRLQLEAEKARLHKLIDDLANLSFNYEYEMKRCNSILQRIDNEIHETSIHILGTSLETC